MTEWGNCCQPFVDDALQVGPGMQEMLLLFLGHIWGHPTPWPEEPPAICRRRPRQVIFIGLTTSARCARPTLKRWGPGWRIRRTMQHLLDCHIRDTPIPLMWTWMEGQTFIDLTHTYHLNLLASCSDLSKWGCLPCTLAPSHCVWWSSYCHPRIWCKPAYPTPYQPLCQLEPWPKLHETVKHYTSGKIKIK